MPRSTPELLRPQRPRLDDLHGMSAATTWGEELAQDLADYKAGRIPWSQVNAGILLHGEPGTGKTIFAMALAATCAIPLIATSYAKWQRANEGHLGDVLEAMHACFELAKQNAPCILFIDEFDAIPTREGTGHNQRWWTSVVAALNEELDGITSRDGVVVIAAANYPERIDPALLRAGRLDSKIEIRLPGMDDLPGILRFHLEDYLLDVDLRGLAVATLGMSGADIERLVRSARRLARKQKRPLSLEDLFAALEENTADVPVGLLRRIAIHEAGHATAAIALKVSRNVNISMVQRGQRSATTYFDPEMEAVTREVVERRIAVALAGRAAEEVLTGDVTAGSGGTETSDLAVANRLAFSAFANWGLADVTWYGHCPPEQLLVIRPDLAAEAHKMLQAAYATAFALITENRERVQAVAEALLVKRALPHEDIVALLQPASAAARKAPRPRRKRA